MIAWLRGLFKQYIETIVLTGAVAGTGLLIFGFREWLQEMGRRLLEWFERFG